MRIFQRFFVLVFASLTFCVAHQTSRAKLGAGVYFGDTAILDIPQGKSYVQHFEIIRAGKSFHFNGYVELEKNRLAIVGLTPVGSRSFAAVLENGDFSYEKLPFYKLPISPRALLAVWQLAFLTTAQLEPALEEASLELHKTASGRQINHQGRIVLRVTHSQRTTTIEYPLKQIALTIETKTEESYTVK